MKLTKLDRYEHIEDIIQGHIAETEKLIESLGKMVDPEICRMRIMYFQNLEAMRNNLMCLRRKMDIYYCMRRREREFHDEISGFGKMPGACAGDEKNQQRREPEPAAGGRAGCGIRHVRSDAAADKGNDEGETIRTDELKEWQLQAMAGLEPCLKL